mgnify:CR=1 FL=1
MKNEATTIIMTLMSMLVDNENWEEIKTLLNQLHAIIEKWTAHRQNNYHFLETNNVLHFNPILFSSWHI